MQNSCIDPVITPVLTVTLLLSIYLGTTVDTGPAREPFIYALHLHPIFEKLFTGVKVWRKGIGHNKVYEIDP